MGGFFDRFKLTDSIKDISQKMHFQMISLFGSNIYSNVKKSKFVDDGYMRNPFVSMVVDKIASVTSRLPYVFVDKNGNLVEGSEEQELWDNPAEGLYGDEFRDLILTDLLVTGEAFVYGENVASMSGNRYEQFEILKSKFVDLVYTSDKSTLKQIKYSKPNGRPRIIEGDDIENVLHIKFPNISTHGINGLSPLQAAWALVSASTSIFEAEDSIFKNRGVSEILTNDSDVAMKPSEQERIQQDFQLKNSGNSKWGKILLTNAKLRNVKLGMSPADLQVLESAISKMRIICSIYGLDSANFNDPDNKTYNNRKEANKAAFEEVYLPLAKHKIIRNFNNWWLRDNWKSGIRLKIDESKIDALSVVNKDLSDKVVAEAAQGILTNDQAYEMLYGKN